MTDSDRERRMRFAAAMLELHLAVGQEIQDDRMEVYYKHLAEFHIEAIERAVAAAIRRHTLSLLPTIGELIEHIRGNGTARAAVAWARFETALGVIGTYESVDFGDPALQLAIEALGGWSEAWRIERLDERERGFRRVNFLRLYEHFQSRLEIGEGSPEPPSYLMGGHEISNRQKGLLPSGFGIAVVGPDGHPEVGDGGVTQYRALPGTSEHLQRSLPAVALAERPDEPDVDAWARHQALAEAAGWELVPGGRISEAVSPEEVEERRHAVRAQARVYLDRESTDEKLARQKRERSVP